jgi:hypothetical protein
MRGKMNSIVKLNKHHYWQAVIEEDALKYGLTVTEYLAALQEMADHFQWEADN